ncbi:hypothetical protein [Paraburkholderia graminis]
MNAPSTKSFTCEKCGKDIRVKAFYDRWHGPNCKAEEKKKLKIERQRTRRGDEYTTILYRDYVEHLKAKRDGADVKKARLKRESHPAFGKCWIYSMEEKRSLPIPATELDTWLAKGWLKGRKQKF